MSAQRSEWSASSEWSEAGALQKAGQVDDWLAIELDSTVTVFSGRVELGTGVATALAQIVAEELDVPFAAVRMVMGDTARTPDEGYTAGSKTIQFGGFALRQAGAEARRALLEKAADLLDAAPEELAVRDGVVSVRGDPTRTITYAALMGGKRFHRRITGRAQVKPPGEYQLVGKPVPRSDLPLKLTGAPSFVHDLRLPSLLHARVVRPPSPAAELVSVDADRVTNAQVVRLGNFVGVVAEREEHAIRAAKEIKTQWRETTRLPRMEDLYGELRRLPATVEVVEERGNARAALSQATTRLSATYCQPYYAHASIGPSCAVADFHDEQLTVWCSTQGVYPLRRALADLLELPLPSVRVIYAEGAGSFGHNGADDAAADAAVLSRAVGHPLRVQWAREDEFGWEPYAPAMVMEVRGGLGKRGDVIAWDYHAWSPSHARRAQGGLDLIAGQLISGQPAPPSTFFIGGDRNAPTNYTFRNSRVTMHWLAASPLRASSFRSLGGAANTFANESFMDELAAAAHRDPVDFRLHHLADARAIAVLETAAQHASWGTPVLPGQGRGIAFAQYENEETYVATAAQVRMDRATGQVRVERVAVAHDCGLVINPDGLSNQIEGNVIQSLSRALKEQVTFNESHITSLDWETYPILRFSEVPEVEIVLINRPDQPPVGAGEPSSITTAAAIANAIFNATGARIRELPFTPSRVLAALSQVAR